MCGFTVYVDRAPMHAQLCTSLARIIHRGPDAQTVREWDFGAKRYVGFGHARLSILDVSSAGDQPMISSNGTIAMVFNGEIYNHQELRAQLPDHAFSGHSDSESLLEYYQCHGVVGLGALRGMFTLAFLHLDTGKLVVARDPMGIKPLYYTRTTGGVVFSSEMRGLAPFMAGAPAVAREDLFEFLSCGFVYEPHTGVEGISKIPAGCYLVEDGGDITLEHYFSLEQATRNGHFHPADIKRSVTSQLAADVKLGVFFSGGVDSSIIAAYARKANLFAANDANELAASGMVDDGPFARAIASNLKLSMETVLLSANADDSDAFLQSVQEVAEGNEELISDFTYLASRVLARAARARGYSVMLSGLGGDELFMGYPRYRLIVGSALFSMAANLLKWRLVRSLAVRRSSLAKKVDRFIAYFDERRFALAYARLLGYFNSAEIGELWLGGDYAQAEKRFNARCEKMLDGFEHAPSIVKAMVLDYHGFLSHNLTVADKSSMSASLELRVPLLDQDMYCGYLGALRNGQEKPSFGKIKLRELLYKMIPRALIDRPKTGFNPPLDRKIAALGEARVLAKLRTSSIGRHINLIAAERIVRAHFSGTTNNTYKVWQLLYLSFWLDGKAAP
jgi:asparagine synthase (glutamine-hydrolysing)